MSQPTTREIEILLNGERRQAPQGATVAILLEHFAIDPTRVAVEIDRQIVRKRDWAGRRVEEGSEVEVVHFVGGG